MGLGSSANSLPWSNQKELTSPEGWELRLAVEGFKMSSGPVSSQAILSPQLLPGGTVGIEPFPALYLVWGPNSLLRTSLTPGQWHLLCCPVISSRQEGR